MPAVNNLRLFAIALIASTSCFFSSCGEKETPELKPPPKPLMPLQQMPQ